MRKLRIDNNTPKKIQISISISEDLVKLIDKMAAEENRNRSNFIANAIIKLAKARENALGASEVRYVR